jgi:hypothetical protein
VATGLERYERNYRALAAELAAELVGIGLISPGSVVVRTTSCGKPGCRCQADPPQRHGPYYQYSRAVNGKTVSRRLDARQADLYREWIANRHRLEQIIAQMEQVSAEAAEIMLRQEPPARPSNPPNAP